MRVEFVEQYSVPGLVLDGTEDAFTVIERCLRDECTYDDGEDVCYVVQFPGRPMELYTEDALKGSFAGRNRFTASGELTVFNLKALTAICEQDLSKQALRQFRNFVKYVEHLEQQQTAQKACIYCLTCSAHDTAEKPTIAQQLKAKGYPRTRSKLPNDDDTSAEPCKTCGDDTCDGRHLELR